MIDWPAGLFVFSHELGDVEDVMDAGEDGEGGYYRVGGWQEQAIVGREDGGYEDEDSVQRSKRRMASAFSIV